MRIAIDCRMYNNSGIGTYLQGILPFMLEYNDCEYLLIGDDDVLNKYIRKGVTIQNVMISIFSVQELFFFPIKEINKCDVFVTPNFNIPAGIKIPIFSYIHDVVFMDIRTLTSKIGYLMRKFYLKRACEISQTIFTVSNFSKSRIEYFFGKKKKIVVANGSIKRDLMDYQPKNLNSPNGNFILFVGNVKKHKGLQTLVDGWELAIKNGFIGDLLIVGEKDGFKTSDNNISAISKKGICFTGRITDDELYEYMCNAKMLIQPSEYEGFGLPPLEALYLETTCILSDIEVFREIYSGLDNCEFFKVGDPISLCDRLMNVKPLKINQRELIENKYDFKNSARLIMNELQTN